MLSNLLKNFKNWVFSVWSNPTVWIPFYVSLGNCSQAISSFLRKRPNLFSRLKSWSNKVDWVNVSLWPFMQAWSFFVFLLFIFWGIAGAFYFCIAFIVLFFWCLLREILHIIHKHYMLAFVLFLLTEVFIFASLLYAVSAANDGLTGKLSSAVGYPLLGTVFLLTSSLTLTGFHLSSPNTELKKTYLDFSIWLGLGFLALQFLEFAKCVSDSLDLFWYSACFMVVSLHFFHVVIGVIMMIFLFWWGPDRRAHYVDLIVLYWHFVDYVWLWVYLCVYVFWW